MNKYLISFLKLFGVINLIFSIQITVQYPLLSRESSIKQKIGEDFILTSSNFISIFKILEESDRKLLPTKTINRDGSITYRYLQEKYEEKKTLFEIKQLIANPPDYRFEKNFIVSALTRLKSLGVKVIIGNTTVEESSAEWRPFLKTIRISPEVLNLGSHKFAVVLNHEIIHIAQSCSTGKIKNQPRFIGAEISLNRSHKDSLSSPLYSNISPMGRAVEIEAYSNQENLDLGYWLLGQYCIK